MLDRLVAEAVRRKLFHYLDLPFPEAATPKNDASFAEGFLDSVVNVRGKQRSLTGFLWEEFVKPLADESNKVSNGGKFKRGTPISAIFFGPPGTSKTELSKKIADFLGWPLVAIDPSHLLRSGMDGIQAEANTIFRMLAETERVVVLFDEFDEFVRERGSSDAEQFSRLLTTAMLPKLASIHKRATLVFIIATNNIALCRNRSARNCSKAVPSGASPLTAVSGTRSWTFTSCCTRTASCSGKATTRSAPT